MGEIKIFGPGKSCSYPYPVCKKLSYERSIIYAIIYLSGINQLVRGTFDSSHNFGNILKCYITLWAIYVHILRCV